MPDDAPLPASSEVSIGVSVPPASLWRFVSDPATPAQFSDELQEASIEGGGPMRTGAIIVGRNQRGDFSWTTRSVVVAYEEPNLVQWATGEPDAPGATWTLRVAAVDGGSLLTHHVRLHEGGEPLTSAIAKDPTRGHVIVNERLAVIVKNLAATVAGIASLATAATTRSNGST
jgi:hypothetical protein